MEPDAELTAQAHAAMPFAALVGVEVVAWSADEVVARLPWADERCTTGATMHGGALMTLADCVGAALAFSNLPDGAVATTTVASTTQFLRGVRDGHVIATARPLHAGSTTFVAEVDLVDGDGRRVGRVTQTQQVLRPR